MLTPEDYIQFWLMYLIGAIGLLVVWWFITRKIPWRMLRDVLRLIAATILLVPYPVYNQEQFLAPALGMSLLEAVFNQSLGLARVGVPILIILALVLAFYLIADTLWQYYRQKRQVEKQEYQQLMEEHDELITDSQSN